MQHYDELWRKELTAHLKELTTSANEVVEAEALFKLDRPLLYSAFIVRKLSEDVAVSDKLRGDWLEVREHPSTRNGAPFFMEIIAGSLEIEDHFDLDAHTLVRMSYSDIASEIIHSDGLIWATDENYPNAFLVFSYRNTLKRAVGVGLDQYTGMLEAIIADQPKRWWVSKDLQTGKITRHAE